MVRLSVFIIVVVLFNPLNSSAQSCRCEPAVCGPCEVLTGTTFYTEKCEGGRTKSCQKPTCELRRNPSKECEASQQVKNEETNVSENSSSHVVLGPAENSKFVGVFAIVRGSVRVISKGVESAAKAGAKVFEKDVVVTDDQSVAKIIMLDKNVLHLSASSRLKIKGFEDSGDKGYSSSTLDLIYGKVRSQVVTQPKFLSKPVFKIRTPSAVAGVRGTDFIVTHVKGGDITKVETLKGTVELGGHGRDEKVLVKKGSYASYVVVASNTPTVLSDDDIGSFIHKGFLTPVYQMANDKLERLDIETEYREDGSDRVVASAKSPQSLCQSPKGEFNQCAWKCVNNPDGESRCRTDIPNVRCVRSKCDASGRWSSEERLPSSHGSSHCQAADTVGPCDY